MADGKKEIAPEPGREDDPHGSRYAEDLPGAARGDRQKFKDMINAGQDKDAGGAQGLPWR